LIPEAIKAFKRALLTEATDSSILLSLGKLYDATRDIESAALYYKQCLKEEEEEYSLACGKAALWLAKYAIAKEEWKAAEGYVDIGLKGSWELDEFKSLKRSIQSMNTDPLPPTIPYSMIH